MEDKIAEAQKILQDLDLPSEQQNKICALTLLALCNIKPNDSWEKAERRSMVLSTEIMTFIAVHYNLEYKSGTRESFRKLALNPFVSFGLIEKNPDDPDLPINSPNTHYAISLPALNTVKKFNTADWKLALENFIKFRNQIPSNADSKMLLRKVYIHSYKSIANDSIELGKFNVFIGVNGCGKTNILEALATVGAERGNDLSFDGLYSRGVRIARPDLIFSSFLDTSERSSIDINLQFDSEQEIYKCSLSPVSPDDIYTKWINLAEEESYPEYIMSYFSSVAKDNPTISGNELIAKVNELILQKGGFKSERYFDSFLSEYAIYDINTKSLRGISPTDSKKTPLGINGEGLDLLIASFSNSERLRLNKCLAFFDWLSEVIADDDDKLKLTGLKPGRSISTLYFRDRYMQKGNNTFSAENSNEGVLHVLFYLALFISKKTPKLLAIDNIETALNPRLCQALISELAKLCEETGKQALITTHNPAILDGLNLLDDEQRLFEVYRDSEGKTKTRRIKFKKDLSDKSFKLSEMWLKGLLGAVPKNF